MKARYTVGFAVFAGLGIGAGATHLLHAQGKPMGYVIGIVNVKDQDGFAKDFAPKMSKTIAEAGGKYLVRGGKTEVIHGSAAAPRIIVLQFENSEKASSWANSPETKATWAMGDKYATFTDYVVDGHVQ